jgi:signal transduction histidine kinase
VVTGVTGRSRDQADAQVLEAQIRSLYQQIPMVLAVNLVNAALVAGVLGSFLGDMRWWLFFGLIAILTAARGVLWHKYRTRRSDGSDIRRWAVLAPVASGISGLIWGAGSAWLFPDEIFAQTFLSFVIGGMCAGALASLSYHLPAYIAYVVPATLPLALLLLIEGGVVHAAMAAMVVVFVFALSVAAYNVAHSLERATKLQLELSRRTSDLSVANARLEAEISERRAAEDQLRQAQKMEALGQLTGGIAHDFNNLLTVVIGQIERAQRWLTNQARAGAMLDSALVAAERGATLTQSLLAFARRQRLDPKPINVPVILDRIRELLKQTIGPSIRLVVEAEDGLCPAKADPNQLELSILNLALNARDAMPDGGTLLIQSERRHARSAEIRELTPGEYVVVSISDTGIGMDKDTLAHAFEPFFTTKGAGRGSGLGLPMVQGFAAQSGGAVHIESAVGHGTTVEIWLPRAYGSPSERGVAEQAEIRQEHVPARILVCDDDSGVLTLVCAVLRDIGYTVWEADDPATALHILEEQAPIDLLLTDYAMPNMNGEALINSASNYQPGIRALLMTGHADALRKGGIAGVPLLEKPFKTEKLTERVSHALSSPTDRASVDSP